MQPEPPPIRVEEPPYLVAGQFDNLEPVPVVEKDENSQPGTISGESGGIECVPFVRDKLGDPHFRGNAGDIEPNSTGGAVGFAVLTTEGLDHVAYIADETDEYWILHESNYQGEGKEMYGRKLKKNSPKIRGYYRPIHNLTFATKSE